jgi:predicted Holliday junction resolvase-like endonuclease
MTPNLPSVVLGLVMGLLLSAVYLLWWKLRYTRAVRRDAVQRSEAVTVGKVSEQLLPFFPEFRFNPRDARFLGAPVDLVVFDGLAEGMVRRVVFVEVKTRGARLTARERLVRDAIEAGRVEWLELRAGSDSGG